MSNSSKATPENSYLVGKETFDKDDEEKNLCRFQLVQELLE